MVGTTLQAIINAINDGKLEAQINLVVSNSESAFALQRAKNDGIDTYAKAEEYFAARQEKAIYEKHIRRLFGLGERKLTKAEDEILDTWRKKFRYGEDMLDAAYEKTVSSAKTPSIKYMHKILESWHAAGVNTPDEIGKAAAPAAEKAPKSYDLDSFFEQAVSKGRKNL